MKDSTKAIFSSARRFFSGTLISRITGVARDVAMAAAFGASASVAALMVAYRLSHLLRRVLGEGALQTAFIPHYEQQKKGSLEQGSRFFRAMTSALALSLSGLIIAATAAIAMAYSSFSPANKEVALLMLILMPSLLFICLYGLNAAFLQCENRYFTAGAAPAAFNIGWIATLAFIWRYEAAEAMPWLALGIVAACMLQWLATVPQVAALMKGSGGWRELSLAKGVMRPLLLATTGVAAAQVNSALDALFARWASLEGPAYLWYAIRIQQLPLSLFGIALAGALLPPLARAIQAGDSARFDRFLSSALVACTALLLPFSFAYFGAGDCCVNLLFGRGDFTDSDTLNTTLCLWGYTAGLLPMGLSLILASAFYARGNYGLPARASAQCVGANVALNSLFILGFGWGPASVALATSLSSWLNLLLLWKALNCGSSVGRSVSIGLLKAGLLSFGAFSLLTAYEFFFMESTGAIAWLIGGSTPSFPRKISSQLFDFARQAVIFGLPVLFYWLQIWKGQEKLPESPQQL